ncbi:unnamed protein product, partial [Ectocarpus sp. 4 AP-2014]
MRRAQGSQLHLEEGGEVGVEGAAAGDVTSGGASSRSMGVTAASAPQAAGGQAVTDGAATTSRRRRRRVAVGIAAAVCLTCLAGFDLKWWSLGG